MIILAPGDWVTHLDRVEPENLGLHRGMWMNCTPYVFVGGFCWLDAFHYHKKLKIYQLRIRK